MRVLLLIAFSFFISFSNGQSLLRYVDSVREANKIPELGFAVIRLNSISEMAVTGNRRKGIANNTTMPLIDDYFHLGSNTKAITSFIAAHLVENKIISWSTKFFDLFPEWKSECDTAYYGITLEDLLAHKARVEPYTSGLEFQELPSFNGTHSEQRKLFTHYLLKEKPVPFNSLTYTYSNAGYTVAALMMEKASGSTWENLVKNTLSDQLHLSYYLGWPNQLNIDQPWGHWIENDSLTALPPSTDYNLKLIEPAGDISMPLPDYAKFIQMHLQGLSGKDNFLKAATYEFLHYGLKDYALGWGNKKEKNELISLHAGSAGTFYCLTIINKTRQVAFIIIANCATEGCQRAISLLAKKLEEKYAR